MHLSDDVTLRTKRSPAQRGAYNPVQVALVPNMDRIACATQVSSVRQRGLGGAASATRRGHACTDSHRARPSTRVLPPQRRHDGYMTVT